MVSIDQNAVLTPEEEAAKKKAVQATSAAPEETAGGTSMAGGTPQSAVAPASNTKPIGSGRFVNLQRYLGANAGGGSRIAGKIGEAVGKQSDQFGKALGATGAVQTQLQAEKDRIAGASGFKTQIEQDPTKLVAMNKDQWLASQANQPVNQNPGIFQGEGNSAALANQEAQYQQYLSGAGNPLAAVTQLRTGATALGDIAQQAQKRFGAAESQLGNVQGLANQTGSEAGRFDLLKQTLGRPNYSRGQQSLDQLLLQAEGGDVLGKLQKDTAQAARLGGQQLGAAQGAYTTGRGDVATKAQEAQKLITGALGTVGTVDNPATPDVDESKGGGALGSLQESLRGRAGEFRSAQQRLKESLESGVGSDTFDRSMLNQLSGNSMTQGLTGLEQGQRLYDINLADYLKPNYSDKNVTEQNIANEQDLARYQALAKLSGTDASYLTPDQLGKAAGLTVSDSSRADLQAALQARQAQFQPLRAEVADVSSADWLNKYAQGLSQELHPDYRMALARQEQGRILSVLEPKLQALNPDRVVKSR